MIAVDIETYDPNLKALGDGSIRGDGRILCVAVYGNTLSNVFDWADEWDRNKCKEILESPEPKIFHNGIYDLSWLMLHDKIKVGGVWHDTLTRASLIDSNADLDLDSCCKQAGIKSKNKDETIEAWYDLHKSELGLKGTVWQNTDILMGLPDFKDAMFKYNLNDAEITWNLFHAQEPKMKGLEEAYERECRLYPVILEMKRQGIRVDEQALDALTDQVSIEQQLVEQQMLPLTPDIIRSPKQLGTYLSGLGLESPLKTKTGNPSWSADALDRIMHPVVEEIKHWKTLESLLNKYLNGSIRKSLVNGRIHATFYPNRSDEGGTVTGRFACRNPNLQNISARDEKHGQKTYGKEMRSLFLPEEGCSLLAIDYSQIEYLLLAHFAKGPQEQWFREQAQSGVDFHSAAMEATGIKIRKVVKNINFGVIYGMGVDTFVEKNWLTLAPLAEEHNMSIYDFAKMQMDNYHKRLPVIKDTMNYYQMLTKQQGYLRSIGGRVHKKPKPVFRNGKMNDQIYKMLNKLIQGSAADVLKEAICQCWEAGLFGPSEEQCRLHLQIHDELVMSCSDHAIEAGKEVNRIMNNSMKERLLVPMKAVGKIGPDWGHGDEEVWAKLSGA